MADAGLENPVVAICDWRGRLVWNSSTNSAYVAGRLIWDYAVDNDKEVVKDALSRAVMVREQQHFAVTSHIGEHFHVWVWPLDSPEVAVCMLGVRVPDSVRLLTKRERDCLEHLAKGRSTQEIAETLDVSVSTVHTHFKRARVKLGLSNVEALIGFAARYCYPTGISLAHGGLRVS